MEVDDGRGPVAIGSAMHRALLAVLLFRANRPVSHGVLRTVLWDGAPPPTAAASLKNHVSKLRRLLGDEARDRLRAVPSGYLLRVDEGELDADEFAALVRDSREARARQDWPEVSRASSAALRLWRGTPLDDAPVDAVHLDVRHLVETHREVLEWHFDAALRQGLHDGLATQLSVLVTEHPLVETFHVQLMQVLYRGGRSADALDVYQQLRRNLVDQLGLEPSAEAQALQQQILDTSAQPGGDQVTTGADAPPLAGRRPGPAQLPADIADFTGRETQVRELCAALESLDQPLEFGSRIRPLAVCAITGMGGVGKTALALHTAHRLQNVFPDGQLYVDLRGREAAPRNPDDVLSGFLRDLGVPDQAIPLGQEAKAAAFRSLTSGRRLLMVLDNARDAAQVRPLLPGTGSCSVLVTSRQKLPGLDGAFHLDLDGLDAAEAQTLLGRIIGPARAAADPEATEVVLRYCAGLPLAVRIAGARLASRPSWPMATLAARLADERRRLDELRLADVAVRGCFQVSYADLDSGAWTVAGSVSHVTDAETADPARALRHLGLCGSAEISLPAAAALFGRSMEAAEEALEILVDACLLDNPLPGRYRLHDLLRVYAAECSLAEAETERDAAVERLARWTLVSLAAADGTLFPNSRRPELPPPDPGHPALEFATREAALSWCDRETTALVATAAAATAHGLHTLAWLIPAYALGYLRQSCRYVEWSAVNTSGLASARTLGDVEAEARLLSAHGALLLQTGRTEESEACLRAALELRQTTGDAVGELALLSNLGVVYMRQQRDEYAHSHYLEVLALARQLGRKPAAANCLNNLAVLETRLGNYDAALLHLEAARAIWHELGDLDGDSVALANTGTVHLRRGDFAAALGCLEEALPVTRSFGNRIGEAEILTDLGSALLGLDRRTEAREHLRQAVQLWEGLHDPRSADAAARLASAEGR
ncbi:tetratricopeptide repeat protein [Catenulispora sp. GP43]|uniref:AfsR/SARP family transcriptional regulator n=1 Tax=Catenulispora sp. GP43 TaxID=3156263 RepID=UPI0035189A95